MKKILLLFLCLVILIPSSLVFGKEKLDGFFWEKLSEDELSKGIKRTMISGFLLGYKVGFTEGITIEYKRVKDHSFFSLKSDDKYKLPEDSKKFGEDFLAAGRAAFGFTKLFPENKDVDFYVSEIDSFLKQFPLCKKMDLSKLLLYLAQVWTFEGKKELGYTFLEETSYKKIAEECLKAPK